MITFVFTKHAERSFLKLPKEIQERTLSKLREAKKHEDIFSLLKRLTDLDPATHRMRIGSYRLILALSEQKRGNYEFLVLDVGHRREIYR